jgi:hypothetical protein
MLTNIDKDKITKMAGPIVGNVIEVLTLEISKEKNRKKIIGRVITPILEDINKRYYPHFMALLTLLIIMTIMMIGLSMIIYTGNNKNNNKI